MNKDIINIKTTPSTNDFAKELLLNNAELSDITIIDCFEQTNGRGQKGNSWESNPGENIILSIILKPVFLNPSQQFYLSMSISLSIVHFLNKYIDHVSIKWPNDIYVGNKKICGILIENSVDTEKIIHSIVGVGLNVNQETFSQNLPNPTSMIVEIGRKFSLFELKSELFETFDIIYNKLKNNELQLISQMYLSNLYRKGIWSYYSVNECVFKGKISTIDEFGKLIVENEQGNLLSFAFKEIKYV